MIEKDEYEEYWKFDGSPWKSRSAWLGWIRSVLRKSWNRHPKKIDFLKKNRIKIPNPNHSSSTRFPQVWGAECSCCKELVPLSMGKKESGKKVAQIDHILPSGSLKSIKDVQGFFERLMLVKDDSLRFLCNVCNKDMAYVEKYKVSLEEAVAVRKAIGIQKQKKDVQWLKDNGITPAKNATLRRKQIVEDMTKESKNV